MTSEWSALVGFTAAGASGLVLTPLATRVATKTGFLDYPRGYRQHEAPTPLLGGAAVVLAFLIAAAAVGAFGDKLIVLLGCTCAMWLLGTLDDRVTVAPGWRIVAATAAAVALNRSGLGWHTHDGSGVDILLAIVWTVGLVNAFNLMDNLDGACATVAAVSGAGIAVLAGVKGESATAGMAFAISGACVAFLRWNLRTPPRIFLGDGGSMPIGFALAGLAMATSSHARAGNAGVLVGALLVGLPILDVALVSVSRTRRGISLMAGGRDHLTHRLLLRVGSRQRVAVLLAVAQAGLCCLALAAYSLGAAAVLGFAFASFLAGAGAVVVLDTPGWRPAGIAVGSAQESSLTHATPPPSIQIDRR